MKSATNVIKIIYHNSKLTIHIEITHFAQIFLHTL